MIPDLKSPLTADKARQYMQFQRRMILQSKLDEIEELIRGAICQEYDTVTVVLWNKAQVDAVKNWCHERGFGFHSSYVENKYRISW